MKKFLETSSPRMINVPSKLIRARNMRPKNVRPLKDVVNQSANSESGQSYDSINSVDDSSDFLQNYNEIVFDNKKIRVYSTDTDLLKEAVDTLNLHFNRRVIDLLL